VDGLKRVGRWGARGVIVTGGEPLGRADCLDFVTRAADLGLEVDLCTNATLVDAALARQLGRALTEISVSLDSADAEVHDRLRGRPGAWRAAVRGIQHLVAAGLELHAITIACDDTCPSLDRTLDLFEDLGVHSVTLLGPVRVPGAERNLRLSPNARAALVADLPRLRERATRLTVNTKRVTQPPSAEACPAGTSIWGIDAGGHLLPCVLLKGETAGVPLARLVDCRDWREVGQRLSWQPTDGLAGCGD